MTGIVLLHPHARKVPRQIRRGWTGWGMPDDGPSSDSLILRVNKYPSSGWTWQ
ncbi:hypothetical protein SCLCIDRAFT_1208577 [Scleroderma citrinum Foug A]|uniref:Uncharacterized protein n=1 Tax=Scleroderma citrinum Foug A TaxID=1036808 RepID=A0A0C3ELU3_9AGAM|nr:hypothetical protein SCLCIDRAFT_1208577 [Scleroderma citrinum Foug A]